jgi:hypothetical protein
VFTLLLPLCTRLPPTLCLSLLAALSVGGAYNIRHDPVRREYHVALDGMVWREGTEKAPPAWRSPGVCPTSRSSARPPVDRWLGRQSRSPLPAWEVRTRCVPPTP